MATLTATANATTGSVLLVGTFTGYPDGYEITVYRVTPDGTRTTVRGGNPVLISGGGFVLFDFEGPLDTVVYYEAVDPAGLLAYDSYTRTVAAGGWGSTDTGQAYTITGTATDHSVNGSQGVHAPTTVNSFRAGVITVGTPTQQILLTTSLNTGVVTGGGITARAWARYTDANNQYDAQLTYTTTNTVTLSINKRVGGVGSIVAAATAIAASFTANQQFTIRFDVAGTTYPVLRAKAWATATEVEPAAWDLEYTDTSSPLTTGNLAGAASRLESGNLNASPQILFDNLYVWGGSAVTVTSNSVTVDASGDYSWLKDPNQPGNNMRIDMSGNVFNPCANLGLTAVVERIGADTYTSATGVFDIVDDPLPNTVAQARKAAGSSIAVISRQLTDITAILDLLAPGTNLLLQLPAIYGEFIPGYGTAYITVSDTQTDQITRDMRVPLRRWTIPYRVTDTPPDTSSGGAGGSTPAPDTATYAALAATGTTYTALAATGYTYAQVAQGNFV